MTLRRLWFASNAWRAVLVQTREELDAAIARAPPWIVVEGDEALRAAAARLAYRGGVNGAGPAAVASPHQDGAAYPSVPTVGRFRDGPRKRPGSDRRRFRPAPGLGPLVVAGLGLSAALLTEWLSFTAGLSNKLVAGFAVPALTVIALAALVYVVWQASGIGRPVRIGWRVESRVQGRLVLARVKEAVLF